MEKSVAVTMRIPQDLVNRIDDAIDEYGHHSTRPDFIVDGMRTLFSTMMQLRLNIGKLIMKDENMSEVTSLLMQNAFKTTLEKMHSEFESYGGNMVQVMVRVPAGLNRDIVTFEDPFKPFRNRMEFMRMSIINELDLLPKEKSLLENPSDVLGGQEILKKAVDEMKQIMESGLFAEMMQKYSATAEKRITGGSPKT